MPDPTRLSSWSALEADARRLAGTSLRALFAADPDRFARFALRFEDLLLDLSKQRLDPQARAHLIALLEDAGFAERRQALFSGGIVNRTEARPALHTLLRAPEGTRLPLDGRDAAAEVFAVRRRLERFAEQVREGRVRGARGEPFAAVLHIGIGGSELGPRLVCEALAPFADGRLQVRFVANIDPRALGEAIADLHPARTLVLVASKTFTTRETLANARRARAWLEAELASAASDHLVALTARPDRARAFGIAPERIFPFWDWVGGRFSLWSSVGLVIALYLGVAHFRALLAGAHAMDEHFRTAPLQANLPVQAALADVWNSTFLRLPARAVVPYDHGLRSLPAYLQQLEMESNGKGVSEEGDPVAWPTGPVVWGGTGTEAQHAFFQHLHQGTAVVPVDFLAAARPASGDGAPHSELLANALAQARALAFGRTLEETRAQLAREGLDPALLARLAPHRTFPGNRPSSFFLYHRLTPYRLGGLLALFEHRVFTQGVVWGIDSFDQWGVELGKELAAQLLPALRGGAAEGEGWDASTRGLAAAARAML